VKLSQLGEFGLIDRLSKRVGSPSKSVVVGIGDDTAVYELPVPIFRLAVKYQLITTDTLIENIHFKLKKTSFQDLGYKALVINISDIASMGGYPTHALVTIGANKNLSVKKIEELYRGINKAAKKYNVDIIGGDTVRSPKELVVSVTLLGEVEKKLLLTRSGAKVGDQICVTGKFGGPASRNFKLQTSNFKTNLNEGRKIAKSKIATSMIDSSDGLIRSVMEICRASKVGANINLSAVPIAKGANLKQALYGGEEYELVFTVPKLKKHKYQVVGEVVAKKSGISLVDRRGRMRKPKSGGYEHFK
jgi:thiamine-monophosphate kinase